MTEVNETEAENPPLRQPGDEVNRPWQFSIASLFLITMMVALILGLPTVAPRCAFWCLRCFTDGRTLPPSLAVTAGVPAIAALVWTRVGSRRSASRGRPMTSGEKAKFFGKALLVCAVLTAVAFGALALGGLGPSALLAVATVWTCVASIRSKSRGRGMTLGEKSQTFGLALFVTCAFVLVVGAASVGAFYATDAMLYKPPDHHSDMVDLGAMGAGMLAIGAATVVGIGALNLMALVGIRWLVRLWIRWQPSAPR